MLNASSTLTLAKELFNSPELERYQTVLKETLHELSHLKLSRKLKAARKMRDAFLKKARHGDKGERAAQLAHLYDVVVADIELGLAAVRGPVKKARKLRAQAKRILSPPEKKHKANALFEAVEKKKERHQQVEQEAKKTGAPPFRKKKRTAIPDAYLASH